MMNTVRAVGALLMVLALALGPMTAGPALADALGDAKAQGLLGERPDGYLGLVKANAPGSVQSLMRNINRKRRDHYAGIAKKNGTPRSAVEAIVGAKLVGKAAPGTYVMDANGRWMRK